jgi:hypothetical protein
MENITIFIYILIVLIIIIIIFKLILCNNNQSLQDIEQFNNIHTPNNKHFSNYITQNLHNQNYQYIPEPNDSSKHIHNTHNNIHIPNLSYEPNNLNVIYHPNYQNAYTSPDNNNPDNNNPDNNNPDNNNPEYNKPYNNNNSNNPFTNIIVANNSNNYLIYLYNILQTNIKNNLIANTAQTKVYDATIISDTSDLIDYVVNNTNIIDYTVRNKNDGSIYFSGNLSYIQLPSMYFNNNGITIACYFLIKFSDKSTNSAVLFDFGNGFNDDTITLTINENNIFNKILIYNNRLPYTAYFYLNDISTYKWHHIALVITNEPIWYLYLDGNPIQLSLLDKFIYPSVDRIRNYNYIGKNNKEEYSTGVHIDEFRIYNKSLSQNEIKNIM